MQYLTNEYSESQYAAQQYSQIYTINVIIFMDHLDIKCIHAFELRT